MAAVSWCCPLGHPVPAELPWVPPARPALLVNAKASCCHGSWPSQAQRPHGHVPSCHSSGTGCKRGEEGVCGVTVHPGMSVQSLSAGKWGNPTGFWVQGKPQQKAAGGVPEQGGQGTQGPFSAVSPVVTLTSHPLLPRSPLLSCCLCARAQSPPGHCHQCRPGAVSPVPRPALRALCSLPAALAEVPVLVLCCLFAR